MPARTRVQAVEGGATHGKAATPVPPAPTRRHWMATLRRYLRRAFGVDVPAAPPHTIAALHQDEAEVPGLNARELIQLRRIRIFGTTGAIMLAIAALGVGARPVLGDPVLGIRVLSLMSRVQTSALTLSITGAGMITASWLLLGRFAVARPRSGISTHRLGRAQLDKTLLLWIIPISLVPPMFSTDVYSYLAQSEIARRGLDPYLVGPTPGLGLDHPFTRNVPTIWRLTPAPYGPLFLWLGRGIATIAGDNAMAGILLHRALALMGVALIVWALPRLAARCGVAPVTALWLGAANPLILLHLVSGVHNEAIMLGLMLAGLEVCFLAFDRPGPMRGMTLAILLAGCTIITFSAMVKIPTITALGFVWMMLARRWAQSGPGPRPPRANWRALLGSAALLGVLALTVTIAISLGSGLGFRWITTLNQTGTLRSWMSISTDLGTLTGFIGILLGLGDHTAAALAITRPLGELAAVFVGIRMLVATYTGRLPAMGALGVFFGALVLFFPVLQPWYLLWAVLPLAAWATKPIFRVPVIVVSAFISVVLRPSGAEYYVLLQAVEANAGAIVTFAVLVFLTRHWLPWRGERAPEKPQPEPGAPQPAGAA